MYVLTDHFIVSATPERTWEFFSAADNLPLITPPWLGFTITSPPATITRDTRLSYTIRWLRLPVEWRTLIIDFTPPRQFIDLQIKGPYALWHHQHTFEPAPEGVRCRDRVIYALPFGPLGTLTHGLVVGRQLKDIFRYRREIIGRELGWVRAEQPDIHIQRVR